MASQIDICNLAIGHLGADYITSLADGSQESISCLHAWDIARDATLSAMKWSFATKRVELSQLSDTPDFGWDYQYLLPSDCLKPLTMNEGTDASWTVEEGNLLTNQDEVELVYTARITDTAQYSALFADALAARLAADIAMPVTRDKQKMMDMVSLFEMKISLAKDHDAGRGEEFERYDMDKTNYTWISTRT